MNLASQFKSVGATVARTSQKAAATAATAANLPGPDRDAYLKAQGFKSENPIIWKIKQNPLLALAVGVAFVKWGVPAIKKALSR